MLVYVDTSEMSIILYIFTNGNMLLLLLTCCVASVCLESVNCMLSVIVWQWKTANNSYDAYYDVLLQSYFVIIDKTDYMTWKIYWNQISNSRKWICQLSYAALGMHMMTN